MPSIGPKARNMRIKKRREWVQEAFKKTELCDVVFFDPDNGLEIKSIKSHNKYVRNMLSSMNSRLIYKEIKAL